MANDEWRGRVPDDGLADRLDRWLPRLLEVSRGEARRLIDAGGVYVDGKRCRVQSRTVGPGVALRCRQDAAEVAARAAKGPQPVIVHRDDALLVVDKPPGMPTQASRTTVYGTVEAWARALPGVQYVALHHRLDRDARGLLALAIDRSANKGLAQAFGERLATRRYRARLEGDVDGDAGVWQHSLIERGRSRRAERFSPKRGKGMRSEWTVLDRGEGTTLVEVVLQTGRTHQIRLQARAVGHPVVGDKLYGTPARGGLRLQAFALALPHPVTGEDLSFELPVPEGFR